MLTIVHHRRMTAFAAMATAMLSSGAVFAAPQDYRFEPVQSKIKASSTAPVAVRLVHVPTSKPVTDAMIVQQKIEMTMQGMSPMAGQVSGLTLDRQGNYAGTADLAMVGDWVLDLEAKVPDETETVHGSIRLQVQK